MSLKRLFIGIMLMILSVSGLHAAAAAGAGAGNVSKFEKFRKDKIKPLDISLIKYAAVSPHNVVGAQGSVAPNEVGKTFHDYFDAAYGPQAQQKSAANVLTCPICLEGISIERPNIIIEPCPGSKIIHPVCQACYASYNSRSCPTCRQEYSGVNQQIFRFANGLNKLAKNRSAMNEAVLQQNQQRVQRTSDASMNGILAGVVVAAGDVVYCVYKRKMPDFKSAAAKGFVAMMAVGGLSHMYADWKNSQG